MEKEELVNEILNIMSMTGTWISISNLSGIIPKIEVEKIVDKTKKERITHFKNLRPDLSEEIIEKAADSHIASMFFSVENINGIYCLKSFEDDNILSPINTKTINLDDALDTLKSSINQHLNYNVFHANGNLSADQIRQALEETLALIEENSKTY